MPVADAALEDAVPVVAEDAVVVLEEAVEVAAAVLLEPIMVANGLTVVAAELDDVLVVDDEAVFEVEARGALLATRDTTLLGVLTGLRVAPSAREEW